MKKYIAKGKGPMKDGRRFCGICWEEEEITSLEGIERPWQTYDALSFRVMKGTKNVQIQYANS